MTAEQRRLSEAASGTTDWQRWGTYVSERAWATVREDYSADGSAWEYFPHDHARSRAYRWNEDGLAGFCDRDQHRCLAVAFWNERDPILKERMFGLSDREGNHGEDVKEYFFVRLVGPRVSRRRHGARRSSVRETADSVVDAPSLAASVRHGAGVRMGLRRRQPPVIAWAAWQVYQIDRASRGGEGDTSFLASVFDPLQ